MPTSTHRAAHYLNHGQRIRIKRLAKSWLWRLELPTWGLAALIYAGWFGTVCHWRTLGPLLGTPVLLWFTAWYMSLQHELIHGHPTRNPRLNQLLGTLPLAVWYPYGLYRDTHLRHHQDEHLTTPGQDPEGYYFSAAQWRSFRPWFRHIVRWRNTLLGRVILGPALDICSTFAGAMRSFRRLEWRTMSMWLTHLITLTLILRWMAGQGLEVGYFLAAISYPALAMTKVRSFLEHRAAVDPQARSVINEAAWPWRLLFLNLNYHLVHHDLPAVPWYGLRKVYLADRSAYQRRSQGFVVRGYGAWLGEFGLRPVAVDVHPLFPDERCPNDAPQSATAGFTTDVRYQSP